MNQQQAYDLFFPVIESGGNVFYKCSLVYAVKAQPGEFIETWTADGLETTNYANPGDFIVQNLQTEALEKYIVSEEMFFNRYKFFYWSQDGAVYMPKGKVKGVIYYGPDIEFVAKWGRNMALKSGDYIVTPLPDEKEVYRIAAKEFYETYEKLS
jgi:kynurenine formamidase